MHPSVKKDRPFVGLSSNEHTSRTSTREREDQASTATRKSQLMGAHRIPQLLWLANPYASIQNFTKQKEFQEICSAPADDDISNSSTRPNSRETRLLSR